MGRAGDGCAQRLLVEGSDEVQAALDQSAEAGCSVTCDRRSPRSVRITGRLAASWARRSRKSRRSSRSSQSANTSSVWSTASTVRASAFSGSAVSASRGRLPGVISTILWPRSRRAASTPARMIDDLPEPEGPTRAAKEPAASRSRHDLDVAVAAEEPLGVVDVVRLEPLPGALGRSRPGLRDEEAGVLLQDRLLEGQHLRRRVDPELPGQDGAQLAQGAQRLALGAGLVLREDEELPAALAQRRGAHQRVRLGHHLTGAPAAQHRVDMHLLRLEAKLVEAPGRSAGGWPVGEVGERGAPPLAQCLLQQVGHPVALARRQEAAGAGHLGLEVVGVDVVGWHRQDVAVGRRLDRVCPRTLRSLTTHDWRFLAAEAGGWSPQTASISSSALTGCPSRVARACSTTRSWGPRRPEPSTVSGPRTWIPTSPTVLGATGRVNGACTRAVPVLRPGVYRLVGNWTPRAERPGNPTAQEITMNHIKNTVAAVVAAAALSLVAACGDLEPPANDIGKSVEKKGPAPEGPCGTTPTGWTSATARSRCRRSRSARPTATRRDSTSVTTDARESVKKKKRTLTSVLVLWADGLVGLGGQELLPLLLGQVPPGHLAGEVEGPLEVGLPAVDPAVVRRDRHVVGVADELRAGRDRFSAMGWVHGAQQLQRRRRPTG